MLCCCYCSCSIRMRFAYVRGQNKSLWPQQLQQQTAVTQATTTTTDTVKCLLWSKATSSRCAFVMQLSCLSPVPHNPLTPIVGTPPLCHAPRHCHGKWPPHGKRNIRNVSVRLISALGVSLCLLRYAPFSVPPSFLLSLSLSLFVSFWSLSLAS